ncbi:MAG: nuclear transport factor 2 family protein [Gammaproteobacteria bacterium]|nr:nuclear transport factor 2 family protein [Gammaproteobacteria bacterium]
MDALQELLETETIKKLRVQYSHYFDGQLLDELVDLFTDDAVCEFGPMYGGDWVGKEQIRANYATYTEAEGIEHEVMHAVTNPWIRFIDDNTANGRWYLLDLRTAEGTENPLILFGIYDDVYKKVDGRWLIDRTRIDFLWPKREYHGPRDL